MSTLHIFWDESNIWGVLAARAVRQLHIPYRLISSNDIQAGMLKEKSPKLLIVPGGNARHKATVLTEKGRQAIRDYVGTGGHYLGFCGGAGLALSWDHGLALCPWQRAPYEDRLQHFMSGHLHVKIPQGQALEKYCPNDLPDSPAIPVWWPGQFDPTPQPSINILATYDKPAKDFWLADLAIASLPEETFATWQKNYGFSTTPTYLKGQPCIIHGSFSDGQYILSYSHLETPASPDANKWFIHILQTMTGSLVASKELPEWDFGTANICWDDDDLLALYRAVEEIVGIGKEHGLLFTRNTWLIGWRTGIPGANINNLRAAIRSIVETTPSPAAQAFWAVQKQTISTSIKKFQTDCIQYLLAERLAMTLARSVPEIISEHALKAQRSALFGPPMQAGGVYKQLIGILDELAFLQLQYRSS